ncbi:hypothetical protein COOONC_19802, partial [Cooperia oncophora]
LIIHIQREKQENTSPKKESPEVTRKSESSQEETVHVVPVYEEATEEASQKETVEAVKEMEQEMSNVALEVLTRDVPQEQTPLDVVPSQCSYEKLK